MIGTAVQARLEIPPRPLPVAGPEAGLEQRVVEDVALGAAAAEPDDPRREGLEAVERCPVVAPRKRVDPLHQRDDDLAGEPRAVLAAPLASEHGTLPR